MIESAKNIEMNVLMRSNGIYSFKQKINLSISSGPYLLKTADTYEELIESFKLRFDVFYKELQNDNSRGLDFDKFDSLYDHLIIICKNSQKIIGTYRVNCSLFSNQSYTEQEFNLDEVLNLPGPHLELGRACIHKDFRKGTVLSLLWRGITEYMNESGASVLFGCSSIQVQTPLEAAMIYKFLNSQNALTSYEMSVPTRNYQILNFAKIYNSINEDVFMNQRDEIDKLIPPLLKAYIKYGARIASQPAIDKNFKCIDLLTILKKEDMTNSLARRLQLIQ